MNHTTFFGKRRFFKGFFIAFILMFCFQNIQAQSSQIDANFSPLVAKTASSAVGGGLTIQPDGKLLIYPGFDFVGGVARSGMARLNSDGTLDASFNCSICSAFNINSAAVQLDGKIIIAGSVPGSSTVASRFFRLNSDGSLDDTFNSPFNPTPNTGSSSSGYIWAVGADGKSYGSVSVTASLFGQLTLYRFNNDGSVDNSFASLTFNLRGGGALSKLRILPDGKLLIGGGHSYGYLFRVNTDGTKDTTFESPTLTYSLTMNPPRINNYDFQEDGKIVFVGLFNTVNGISRNYIARLNIDGSVDQSFNPTLSIPPVTFPSVTQVAVQPDQKILVKGNFTGAGVQRFNPDGTQDNTFVNTLNYSFTLDSSGRLLIFNGDGYARLTPDGMPDPTFTTLPVRIGAVISILAIQGDGKIIAGGDFSTINNITVNKLARLNPDGTSDTSFNAGSGPNTAPSTITVQPDGKIIISGSFTNYNGVSAQRIARLNADGSFDNSFVAAANNTVEAVAIQPDGKILIGGAFTTVNDIARNGLARLNADGSLDTAFNATPGSSSIIRSIIVQPDGKIVIGGTFSGINGFARTNMARLNTDGTLDTSFNAGSITVVNQIIRQSDGKYLIRSTQVFRRNSDGSADSSFQQTNIENPFLSQILLRADGSVVVVGTFERINNNPRRNIARFTSSGILDTSFLPDGADNSVLAIAGQTDGKMVGGGSFKNIGSVNRIGIARIENVPVSQLNTITRFDFDGDGRADYTVYRPSNNVWYQLLGVNFQFSAKQYGLSGDLLTPEDYDGDGKTDLAIFRQSSGDWVYARSANNNAQVVVHWGQNGDIPLPSDIDGDGKADFVVYRPSTLTWYRLVNGTNNQYSFVSFGAPEDKPVIGDFDGDGKSDPAVFRPSTAEWFYAASSQNGLHLRVAKWGVSTDKLVPADYDGDGKTDAAIYRDGVWAIFNSSNGSNTILGFGQAGDIPVAADYDGDGKADQSVYRPSNGTWYMLRSTQGFSAVSFGTSGDIPIQSVYNR